MSRNPILILAIIFQLLGCTPNDQGTFHVEVGYSGALRNFMKEGDISAKVDLSNFETRDHFYALGAFENLKGEIQIFDGKPYNTHVTNRELSIDTTFEKKASLLVFAIVKKWNVYTLPNSIKNMLQLEQYLATTAASQDLSIDKPFPFLISGIAEKVDWHVIDWEKGDMDHTHEKHMSSGLQGTLKNARVEIIGFHSANHKGIFTHHTTPLHLHVKSEEEGVAGHVDDLVMNGGMTLMLPAKEKGLYFDSISKITGVGEYYRLMDLSLDDFDQSWEGFRKHSDNYELVSLIIPEYLEVNGISGARSRNLHWHLGQIHAFNGNYESAIKEMKQSFEGGSPTWAAYVSGSIAFLERDKAALEEALGQLESQENQMNIEILRSFVRNFEMSYAEAINQ